MNITQQKLRFEPVTGKRVIQSGFTLVELLVVITIIGILMAIVAGAIRGANQDTLVAKTRGTIAKIDSVLSDRYDDYLTRIPNYQSDAGLDDEGFPVVIPNSPSYLRFQKYPVANAAQGIAPFDALANINTLRERVRLAAVRDLMRMELPDCIGDLYNIKGNERQPVIIPTGFSKSSVPMYMQPERPVRLDQIVNKVAQVNSALQSLNRRRADSSFVRWSDTNSNEELLYLIVEGSELNGSSAIELFGNSEIADTDNDGLFELIDAWGNPIRWLRWPSGFNSIARTNPDPLLLPTLPTDYIDPVGVDVGYDVSQFDATNPQWTDAMKPSDGMRPLIISGGADGRFGIRFQWSPSIVTSQSWVSPTTTPFYPSLFSSSDVTFPYAGSGWPRVPAAYGVTSVFKWPDPYHPRFSNIGGLDDPQEAKRGRLGSPLLTAYDGSSEIIGVLLPAGTVNVRDDSVSSDNEYLRHTQDNVSNLDESGASL